MYSVIRVKDSPGDGTVFLQFRLRCDTKVFCRLPEAVGIIDLTHGISKVADKESPQ
jgi:hypothetical protein